MVSRGPLAEKTMEQSSNDTSKSHYSFGDNRLAALRLEYLAAAFAPSSRRFLQGTKPSRVELALDLGSGIGVTTALVREVTNAPCVAGYERSGNFLAIARRQYTMRVAAHVVEHVLGVGEGSLGVDHPIDILEGVDVQTPLAGIAQFFERTEEFEFAGVEGPLEVLQKQTAEQAG